MWVYVLRDAMQFISLEASAPSSLRGQDVEAGVGSSPFTPMSLHARPSAIEIQLRTPAVFPIGTGW